MMNSLDCSDHKAEAAVRRALQLYSDLKELKTFGAYRYYCQGSLGEEDLKAMVAPKKNYIRKTKGRANRIGHKWEAVAEWFIKNSRSAQTFRLRTTGRVAWIHFATLHRKHFA